MWNILFGVAVVLVLVCMWVAIFDSYRFVVRSYEISDGRILQDCRLVVVADLHNKCYGKGNEVLIRAIREQKPDLILIVGDILTARRGAKPDRAMHFIEELTKIAPICYGNGNHEHRLELYPNIYGTLAQEYEDGLKKIGIKRLVNAYTVFREKGIAVYGSQIHKSYYKRGKTAVMREDYLGSVLGTPDAGYFTILIAHNPDYCENYAKWGADLTLSGHIHGGIVRIPWSGKGVLSPAVRFFPKYDGGLFETGDKKMIVSRGLGSHTIPFRLFNPGELVVVELTQRTKGERKTDGDTGKVGGF